MKQAPRPLPEGLLLSFYGDDFTGSTATMEAFTFAGLPTALFLDVPTPERLARFAGYRGIGLAGIARSQSPEWMDQHLPAAFHALAALKAPLAHYKVCSTFDSAPHIGSIGRAIELALPIFAPEWVPLLVAAPANGRYQAFGNLFAAIAGTPYRLDRHPVMARHPITPMAEADLGQHLARQTGLGIGLVDLVSMKSGASNTTLQREQERGARIISLDVVDDETLIEAGRLIWERCGAPGFIAGSQGVEHALVAYWRAAGLLAPVSPPEPPQRMHRIACVSGSCSPVTAGQIRHAEENGFEAIRLDATRAIDANEWDKAVDEATNTALRALGQGRDPLIFTASGPDDPAVGALQTALAASNETAGIVNDRIGAGLGRLLDTIMTTASLRRGVIAGGDTSGHAALAMGIFALTAQNPIAPGAPLCRAFSDTPARDGREIALKGGQMGQPDFFVAAKG